MTQARASAHKINGTTVLSSLKSSALKTLDSNDDEGSRKIELERARAQEPIRARERVQVRASAHACSSLVGAVDALAAAASVALALCVYDSRAASTKLCAFVCASDHLANLRRTRTILGRKSSLAPVCDIGAHRASKNWSNLCMHLEYCSCTQTSGSWTSFQRLNAAKNLNKT